MNQKVSSNPKFFRLTFRAGHRITGSSWAEPIFNINIPNNYVAGNINKVIKIVPDYVHIWIDTTANIEYSTLEVRLKNIIASNMYETTGAGVYANDTTLCRIHNDTIDDTNKLTSYKLDESRQNVGQTGFITHANIFNNNQIQFKLLLPNGSNPVSPASKYQDYFISLGVYCDYEEGYEHSH